jgi:hypothetical protein
METEKSKLYRGIVHLNKVELRFLSAYVHSDIHGYPSEMKKLYDIIEQYIMENKPFPGNTELIRFMKSKQPLTDQDIRLYKSYLFKCFEQTLILLELQKQTFTSKLLLIKAQNKRGMTFFAEEAYKATSQKMSESDLRNSDFYDVLFKLEDEWYKTRLNEKRKEFDFSIMSESLDKYYLAEKFRIATLELNYMEILGKPFVDGIIPTLLLHMEKHQEQVQEPSVGIYYFCYMCFSHPDDESWFEKLYALIDSCLYQFPKEEQRDIVLLTNNFCIRKINKGENAYLEKSFNLYKMAISSGALLEKGYLSRFTFKNIVTLGIRLKQFSWTKKFIEDNIHLLEKKYQSGSYAYNAAFLAYETNHFDQAIDLLNKADQDDVFMYLSSKNLQIKIYYEMGNFDLMEYLMGSVTAFLKRKNIDKIYKDNYSNIISLLRKLLQLRHLTSSQRNTLNARKEKVRKAISSAQQLTERKWLLQKLDEIV